MVNHPVGPLTSCSAIHRHRANPILTANNVPYSADLIFNAAITFYQGRYVMVFRNDACVRERLAEGRLPDTTLGLAFSADGVTWDVQPAPIFQDVLQQPGVIRAYDPRLTVLDGRCAMCFALDTHNGIRGGIALTEDFQQWEIVSLSAPDNRNMVLFPERIGGRYARLERPFPMYGRAEAEQFDVWIAFSPDLRHWGDHHLLLDARDVPFANAKIGPAAPPVKTARGWLTTFHAVDIDPARGKNGWEDVWQKRYTAGLMLLDLADPRKVIGVYDQPLLVPEASYETAYGFRNDVVFPGGMILEDNGEVKLYYGAADTVECLATAHVDDLLALFE